MKIERAEIFLLRLPLSQPITHHTVSRSYTDNIVLRLRSEGLEGYGEAVPRTYVTGESAHSACQTIRQTLLGSVSGRKFNSVEEVKEYLSDLGLSPIGQSNLSAFCAFELALLDLSAKYWDHSLEHMFGTHWHQPPPYSAVIPLLPAGKLKGFLNLVKKSAMRNIKIKVGTRIDPVVFEQTLSILGCDVDLRVDANGAWTEAEALRNIEQIEPYGVRAVEQPVEKGNLKGMKQVTARSRIPIIADESVCSVEDARKLLDMGACHALNVRLSKCGGFFGSLAVLDIARRGGMKCQIGCQVGETGILSSAGRHLAGWFDGLLYLEGSFGTWVLREDIVEEDIRFGTGGHASLLIGKGLGVHVRLRTLERYSRKCERVAF